MPNERRELPSSFSVGTDSQERKALMPLHRIELHVHLDGALRIETIYDLLKAKSFDLPGRGTLRDLKKAIVVEKPKDLQHFLLGYQFILQAIVGDLKAIRRISYEFCEDEAANGVAYFEARFSPHYMMSPTAPEVTPAKIVEAVLEGFKEGERDFGVKARVILCCIRGRTDETVDTLKLCETYRDRGVVGLDIAGDEGACLAKDPSQGIILEPIEVMVFTEAKNLGIHRTVHAGEAGPAQSVRQALTQLHAERIGHGYRVVQDEDLYQECLRDRVHFETCPMSSVATGSVALEQLLQHPVVRFAADSANFSISTDGATVPDASINDTYEMLRTWGFTEAHFARANFNAAGSVFLPEDEKKDLKKQLLATYLNDY